MGESRRRGTFEERKSQAIERDKAFRKKSREKALMDAKSKPPTELRTRQINYLAQILAMAMDNRNFRVLNRAGYKYVI